MGLFDKFDNIYNTNISASQVCNMKVGSIPYEDYDVDGNLIGYYWHYGDTVELNFIIDGEITLDNGYITAADFLKEKNAKIAIYSFRYETIFETVVDASTRIKLIIDEETSNKLLRGIYYITLTIFKDNESIYIPIVENGDCRITVK